MGAVGLARLGLIIQAACSFGPAFFILSGTLTATSRHPHGTFTAPSRPGPAMIV